MEVQLVCEMETEVNDELQSMLANDDEGGMNVFVEDSDLGDSDSSSEEESCDDDEICNGVKWSHEPVHNVRLRRNIVNERQLTLTNVMDELSIFGKLFTEEIRRVILRCTNRKATALRVATPQQYRVRTYGNFSFSELNAFLGFIIRAGADRDNLTALSDLYKEDDSIPFYRACMSRHKVEFLLKCLRFDNFLDREERKKIDKLAAIRDVWDIFVPRLRKFYITGTDLAVDKQLVGYRGKIPGKNYMPSKPQEYGLKKFWICEVRTGYALNDKNTFAVI